MSYVILIVRFFSREYGAVIVMKLDSQIARYLHILRGVRRTVYFQVLQTHTHTHTHIYTHNKSFRV